MELYLSVYILKLCTVMLCDIATCSRNAVLLDHRLKIPLRRREYVNCCLRHRQELSSMINEMEDILWCFDQHNIPTPLESWDGWFLFRRQKKSTIIHILLHFLTILESLELSMDDNWSGQSQLLESVSTVSDNLQFINDFCLNEEQSNMIFCVLIVIS